MSAAIELIGITKRFPGVIANDNVNLTVERGEIHAICGENGAGKSTLMKMLYGMQAPDEGRMLVDGKEVHLDSPSEAIELGIGMVHQHFMLAEQLTVLENVILGSEPVKSGGVIDFKEARSHFDEVGEAYGLTIDPDDLVETLEVGERQRVEIIKVLFRGAEILILDEPTAVLVPQEVEELFRNMRELKANGATILFIDHKLDEVLEIADSITVLRQGRTIATVDPNDVTAGDLAELMVGSELPTPDTTDSTVTDEVMLSVSDVTVLDADERPVVDNVSLDIRRGEIVGIAGVEGNGQHELVSAIMGMLEPARGTVSLGGERIDDWSVRERREAGVAYVPQDRHSEGLLLNAPLWENAALGHQTQPPYAKGIWIDREGSRSNTERIREIYDVRTPNVDVSAHALSGGNQQKLILGREIMSDPRLLIASHPTRGIDVGAQAAVWEHLRNARAAGLATLLISADLDELIGLSDTIVVMFRGRLVATLDPNDVTPRDLGAHMTGSHSEGADA
ncbi:ABC transporter ATP-binding protein [Ilumatobacter coccineus]|uniref:Putative nucleoside ABC transporter ATP-binding protein n=1 Tax=Ilumatobacter coccineus (strain NBRC 103263 / KCTC 29153 / YM16-304) TaxID=1313172 RepID=A0A6C7E8G3_ILUCY|nr:ABC transporter ATP-binding protein [Ilumatobacter coccineus]BAN01435.1 putative nucleoside ABC transporter ATP-binding protein [Ilumatobacter coccineus YM16-304]